MASLATHIRTVEHTEREGVKRSGLNQAPLRKHDRRAAADLPYSRRARWIRRTERPPRVSMSPEKYTVPARATRHTKKSSPCRCRPQEQASPLASSGSGQGRMKEWRDEPRERLSGRDLDDPWVATKIILKQMCIYRFKTIRIHGDYCKSFLSIYFENNKVYKVVCDKMVYKKIKIIIKVKATPSSTKC